MKSKFIIESLPWKFEFSYQQKLIGVISCRPSRIFAGAALSIRLAPHHKWVKTTLFSCVYSTSSFKRNSRVMQLIRLARKLVVCASSLGLRMIIVYRVRKTVLVFPSLDDLQTMSCEIWIHRNITNALFSIQVKQSFCSDYAARLILLM